MKLTLDAGIMSTFWHWMPL